MKGYFPAKVIDNVDTKKQGRVKIKIEHLHFDFTDDMLPWAMQSSLSTGGSDSYGSSSIPEIDSYLWIWFEDTDVFYRQPYYIMDLQFTGKQPHNLFETNIKSALGSASSYPNTKYTYYKNGICIGVDSSSDNPEIFIYHPSATIFIDNAGKVKITSTEIELLGGTTASEATVLGETLQTLIENMLIGIEAITVTNPETTTPIPINNIATFTQLRTTTLPTILSENIKNN